MPPKENETVNTPVMLCPLLGPFENVIVTSEFENEDAATEGTEPNKTDVKITEFKVENTKWKKGGLADE